MVKNLNQLKKTIKKGTCLEILVHCRPEFTGQKRRVTMANTQGFYSIVPDEPDHKVSLAMMERDLFSGGVVPPTGSFMTTSAVSTAKAKNIPKNFWLCPSISQGRRWLKWHRTHGKKYRN